MSECKITYKCDCGFVYTIKSNIDFYPEKMKQEIIRNGYQKTVLVARCNSCSKMPNT